MFRGSYAFMCFEAAECSTAFMRLDTETSCRGQNIPYGVLYLLGTIHTIIIETTHMAWRTMVGRGTLLLPTMVGRGTLLWRAMVGRGTLLWPTMVGRGDIAAAGRGEKMRRLALRALIFRGNGL